MKTCISCGQEKDESLFYKGSANSCKECVKARAKKRYKEKNDECKASMKKWAKNNPERSRQIKDAWVSRNAEYIREYYTIRRREKPEVVRSIQKRYQEKNPHIYSAAQNKRRAAKLNATPSWANFEKINEFYVLDEEMTRNSGNFYEVDHIIPLQGKNVCGLHVENNLRVITREENRKKSNKLLFAS